MKRVTALWVVMITSRKMFATYVEHHMKMVKKYAVVGKKDAALIAV
jgi:hypothetical protein